mgnify:FL=1
MLKIVTDSYHLSATNLSAYALLSLQAIARAVSTMIKCQTPQYNTTINQTGLSVSLPRIFVDEKS